MRSQQIKSDDSASHSSESEQEEARDKKPQPTSKHRVTHLTDKSSTGTELLCVVLPIRQTQTGTANMLYDSGSTISLIKLKNLKDDTLIYDDKVMLTGVTGHQIQTIGKMHATIKLNQQKLKHLIYVVRFSDRRRWNIRNRLSTLTFRNMQLQTKSDCHRGRHSRVTRKQKNFFKALKRNHNSRIHESKFRWINSSNWNYSGSIYRELPGKIRKI